jgi:PAS domain-containing protein
MISRDFVADVVGAAVDAVPHPFIISDYETIVFANSHGYRLMGARNADDLVGQPVSRFLHPDIRDAYLQRRLLLIECRQTLRDVPTKFITLDGSAISGQSHLAAIDLDGLPCVLWIYHGVMRDSARPGNPPEQAADRERSAMVFDALPECLLIHDDEYVLAANGECRRLLGAAEESDLIGRRVESVLRQGRGGTAQVQRRLAASRETDEPVTLPANLVRLDGRTLSLTIGVRALRADGRVAFLVAAKMG